MFKRLICAWRTGHKWRALGSVMIATRKGVVPHFHYSCDICGAQHLEEW